MKSQNMFLYQNANNAKICITYHLSLALGILKINYGIVTLEDLSVNRINYFMSTKMIICYKSMRFHSNAGKFI